MTKQEVTEKVISIIADRAGILNTEVSKDLEQTFENDLGFDSLDRVELAMSLESQFDIFIDDISLEDEITSVQSMINKVISLLEEKGVSFE